jgi:hypothetical protein
MPPRTKRPRETSAQKTRTTTDKTPIMCIDSRLSMPLMRLMQLSDAELGQLVRNAMRSITEGRTGDILMIVQNSIFSLTEHALGWELTVENLPPEKKDSDVDDNASSNDLEASVGGD